MLNIWHDTALMQTVSKIVARVALMLLLIALGAWLLQRPYFSINQFRIVGNVAQLDEAQLHEVVEKNLTEGLSGGFFSMDLSRVQESLEHFSWIKSTSVRRVWPHEVEIAIQAHQPIATWGSRYLSANGRLFDAQITPHEAKNLLNTTGPEEAAQLMAQQIPVLQGWFKPTGWQIKSVHLSARYSWRIGFGNGLEIEMGRSDTPTALQERANRLIGSTRFIQENMGDAGGYIDLRYPNGFAMRTSKLHRVSVANNTVKTGENHD